MDLPVARQSHQFPRNWKVFEPIASRSPSHKPIKAIRQGPCFHGGAAIGSVAEWRLDRSRDGCFEFGRTLEPSTSNSQLFSGSSSHELNGTGRTIQARPSAPQRRRRRLNPSHCTKVRVASRTPNTACSYHVRVVIPRTMMAVQDATSNRNFAPSTQGTTSTVATRRKDAWSAETTSHVMDAARRGSRAEWLEGQVITPGSLASWLGNYLDPQLSWEVVIHRLLSHVTDGKDLK